MHKTKSGFTIVELLIVIVVIGILAAISLIAYTGIQQRANNTSRVAAGTQWIKLFDLYKASFGSYPTQLLPPGPGYCLGTGFPNGYDSNPRCRSYKSAGTYTSPAPRGTQPDSLLESSNAALMAELKKVGPLPGNPIPSASKEAVGPFIDYDSATLQPLITIVVDGVIAADANCGGNFISDGADPTFNMTYCSYMISN